MEEKVTLTSMFESNKQVLKKELADLVLPRDTNKIQKIVSDYLNLMFDNEGEYRQTLTQSEDYILQAALSLLQAQQNMAKEVMVSSRKQPKKELNSADDDSVATKAERVNHPSILVGTTVGGSIGGLLLSTWGAVFGAIAGTAIVLYSTHVLSSVQSKTTVRRAIPKEVSQPVNMQASIDVEAFLGIVKGICESVDSLMDTFRAQINRVVNKYESQEKPTLEREYRFLLEGIQSLLGYKRTHSDTEDKYVRKLQERTEELAELLDNYNLTVVDYTEEQINWFEKIPNSKTLEIKMISPAIVKNGQVVLKGKIYIPE